jgi:tetrahydromethanopterin S-methyltransferase subunit B
MSVINTNVKALVSQESMRASNLSLSTAMERLSTGSKINSAKDDAAGLAITNRMTAQVRGMSKAINNVNDAISMSQTAEGAMSNVGDILQRIRELAVQSATGTVNDSDRASLQLEVSQLKQQIDVIAGQTNHNNIKLLDGSAQNVVIQAGTNSGDIIKLGFDSMKTVWGVLSSIPFLYILYVLFVEMTKASSTQPAQVGKELRGLRWLLLATWGVYPISYLLPQLGISGSDSFVGRQIGYSIADVLAKCLYGLLIYKIARLKSYADDPEFEAVEGHPEHSRIAA